jgi:hypothetical protein
MIYVAVCTPGGEVIHAEGTSLTKAVAQLRSSIQEWSRNTKWEPPIMVDDSFASASDVFRRFPNAIVTSQKTAAECFVDTIAAEQEEQ